MKKWYYWFFLTLIFAVGGIWNYFDGKQIVAPVIQVGITVILAFVQLYYDKKKKQ